MSSQENVFGHSSLKLLHGASEEHLFATSVNEDLDDLFATTHLRERKVSANSDSTDFVSSAENETASYPKPHESSLGLENNKMTDNKFKFSNILSHSVIAASPFERSLIEVEKVY